MPSKSKKHTKTPSTTASPRTPTPSRSTPEHDVSSNEEQDMTIASCLERASSNYPSLISKSAFTVRVVDVETEPTRGCRVWLSEADMLSHSLAPGSLVSVSLPDMGFSNGLSLFSGECCDLLDDDRADCAGKYFAVATVFPSLKVAKNGVRLSLNLSYTVGSPLAGRVLFIYPTARQFQDGFVNGNGKTHDIGVNDLSLCMCKELHLELVFFGGREKVESEVMSEKGFSGKKRSDLPENGLVSSPKTPQTKLASQGPSKLASPSLDVAGCYASNPIDAHASYASIEEALKDESSKKLLATIASSWLSTRILMKGNFVAIPILSVVCIFRVVQATKMLDDSTNQQLIEENSNELSVQSPESKNLGRDACIINYDTKIHFVLKDSLVDSQKQEFLQLKQLKYGPAKAVSRLDVPKLGGLSKEYAVLKEIIVSSMQNALSSLGLRSTKGVLLHGPPGTGKTYLALSCARDAGVNLFTINGPEIISQYHGESEQAMREVFDSASQAAPAVVLIDELDAVAPARKDGGEELSHRMVTTLLNLMDGINRSDGVLVIAATNRPDSIEPALRRPGRFDREIEIGVPSPQQRLDILHTLLSEMEHSLSDMQVQNLAMATHGYVGADLAALCNEAALVCLRRYNKTAKGHCNAHSGISFALSKFHSNGEREGFDCSRTNKYIFRDSADSASTMVVELHVPASMGILPSSGVSPAATEITDDVDNKTSTGSSAAISSQEEYKLEVCFDDFERARMKVRPSAMREVVLEVPKVNWEDVGGQREVKNQLMEAVEWPQRHRNAFKRIGTCPPTGVLMYGPPGCSKTLMARAVASEAGLNFLAVKGPELFSKWVGESEKAVKSLFAKARANAPSIVFFDEIDALASIRGKESDGTSVSDRVIGQLLTEMDGLRQRVNVTVIAATNRPDKMDPAILRPGRFDRLLYVGPPNESDREDIFRIHLHKVPCCSDVSIKELACLTDGFTGADVSLICRQAAVAALEESIDASEVKMRHFMSAIEQVQPTDVEPYQQLSAKFQRLVISSQSDRLDNQHNSSKPNWFPIWNMIKSIMRLLIRFPGSGTKT